MKNIALILASGNGERSGLNQPKQFFEVGGKTLLELSVEAFNKHSGIDGIVVVSHPDFLDKTEKLVCHYEKVLKVIAGGNTRQESSYNGVFAIQEAENILIHDAVRAFVTEGIISSCLEGLNKHKAVCTAIETSDTILEVDENGRIVSVPQRKTLRSAQTPQCFKLDLIRHAHEFVKNNGLTMTDDCGLILASKLADVYVVSGSTDNLKITYPRDLEFAEFVYKKQ